MLPELVFSTAKHMRDVISALSVSSLVLQRMSSESNALKAVLMTTGYSRAPDVHLAKETVELACTER